MTERTIDHSGKDALPPKRKQTREEWLEERRSGIGGSDVAPILGMSKWSTPYTVYADKRGELEPQPENIDMLIGTLFEPWLFAQYKTLTGVAIRKSHKILRDKEHPFLLANVDALHKDRVVEFKTARNSDDWGQPGTDQVPQAYLLQCQHYMRVTGKQVCDLGVLFKDQRIPEVILYEIHRDDDLISIVVPKLVEFWECVQNGIPPAAVSPSDALAKWRRAEPVKVAADPALEKKHSELLRVRAAMSDLKTLEDTLKTEIMEYMQESDTLTDSMGEILATWKAASDSVRVDSKLVKALYPEIAKECSKVVPGSRRFLLKGLSDE